MINLSIIPLQTPEALLPYTVGALLYCPATNEKVTGMLLNEKIKENYSLAFCLEDAIQENAAEYGKNQIKLTFESLYNTTGYENRQCIPKLFIRVGHPGQITELFYRLEKYQDFLAGFILPKYSEQNAESYHRCIRKVNAQSKNKIWMLPIIENSDLIPLHTRYAKLGELKTLIDSMSNYVLNIRVGSNDFLKGFGIRRSYDKTIYDILSMQSLLGDIITTFGQDYVVSGPVWEYFGGEKKFWVDGLKKEISIDKLNGFIGKTVIHPNQIAVVNEALKVSQTDYEDAKSILRFHDPLVQVVKSTAGQRMNEIKTHTKWAEKTLALAEIYGVIK